MRYLVLMWPGFARAWWRGELYGVALAILFSVVVQIAWTATFLWPMWFSRGFTSLLWLAVFGAAICSFVVNLMKWQMLFGNAKSGTNQAKTDEAFRHAQRAYLRGEFFEAEAVLHPTFAAGHEDVESALLLASILRRTNRVDQALRTLDRLSRLERSAAWTLEIYRERQLCNRIVSSAKTEGDLAIEA